MGDALQVLLDSGGLYLALGAVLCIFLALVQSGAYFKAQSGRSPLIPLIRTVGGDEMIESAIPSPDSAQSPQHRRFVRERSSGRCC